MNLPVPPVGAAAVIEAAGQPEIGLERIAPLVERDPALSAATLRLANSSVFGCDLPLRSVRQAAVRIGARSLRNVAVQHIVRALSAQFDPRPFELERFWEDSLRRATAARILADRTRLGDPGEAFTTSLLQDLAVLAMAELNPDKRQALMEAQRLPGPQRVEREAALFGEDHCAFFQRLATHWNLPADLCEVVLRHHDELAELPLQRADRLLKVARAADALADVTQCDGDRLAIVRAKRLLDTLDGLSGDDLGELVSAVAAEMVEHAETVEMPIGTQPEWSQLVQRANEALVTINVSYEELTRRLEEALAEKEYLTRELRRRNEELRRLASTDPLTGARNRRAFSERIFEALEHTARTGRQFSILTLDLDHFKTINDTHGHAAGDDVLVEIVRRVQASVRPYDVVGRLGGEEFGVLLEECGGTEGSFIAQRLRMAIRDEPIHTRDGVALTITASFGGVTVTGKTTVDEALRMADLATYASKHAGRDHVTWGPTL